MERLLAELFDAIDGIGGMCGDECVGWDDQEWRCCPQSRLAFTAAKVRDELGRRKRHNTCANDDHAWGGWTEVGVAGRGRRDCKNCPAFELDATVRV